MWKLLSKLKCKMMVCCNSKCSMNDTDGDGVVDSIVIESCDEQKKRYDTEKEYTISDKKLYNPISGKKYDI